MDPQSTSTNSSSSNSANPHRCTGPFASQPANLSWRPPSYVRKCMNPAHGGHFVDTRTGKVLLCTGTLLHGRAPGPACNKRCMDHGHIVNANTQEVIG